MTTRTSVNRTNNYQMQLFSLQQVYPQIGHCPACQGRGAVMTTNNQIGTCPNCWGTALFGMNFQQVSWFQQALKAVRFVKHNPWAAKRAEFQRTCDLINRALSRYGINMPSIPWEEKLKKLAFTVRELYAQRLAADMSKRINVEDLDNQALTKEILRQVEIDNAASNSPAVQKPREEDISLGVVPPKPKRTRKPRKPAAELEAVATNS